MIGTSDRASVNSIGAVDRDFIAVLMRQVHKVL